MIRSLRVTNGEDIVPAAPPASLPFLGRLRSMKHTGINLRLTSSGMKLRHSTAGGLWNTVSNSVLKPVWGALDWHLLPLHEERMKENKDALNAVTLDGLYKDAKVTNTRLLLTAKPPTTNDDEDEEGL